MSIPPDPTTLPEMASVPVYFTPGPMQAVTLENRMASVEAELRSVPLARDAMLADMRAEMASIRADYQTALATGLAVEAKAREALENRLSDLASKLDGVIEEMATQTVMIRTIGADVSGLVKTIGGILANPRVQAAGWAVLAALTALSTYFASRLQNHPVYIEPPVYAPAPIHRPEVNP